MAKTATLNIRTDPGVKAQAEQIYQSFGITLTDAVNIFLRKTIMEGGLPFAMRESRPNAATLAAIREADDILAGRIQTKGYSSAQALFDELDAEIAVASPERGCDQPAQFSEIAALGDDDADA